MYCWAQIRSMHTKLKVWPQADTRKLVAWVQFTSFLCVHILNDIMTLLFVCLFRKKVFKIKFIFCAKITQMTLFICSLHNHHLFWSWFINHDNVNKNNTYWNSHQKVTAQAKSGKITHLLLYAYKAGLSTQECCCARIFLIVFLFCSFVMWSGENVNITLLALSPQGTEGCQTSGWNIDRRLQ